MRKMPFGEADFLVRVLTRDFGKMDVLAKGARKTASKLNAHLDLLNHIRLQFVRSASREGGNGERIPTLTDAEVILRLDDWFSDAEKMSVAGRVLKVLDMVILAGVSDEALFNTVLEFFSSQAVKDAMVLEKTATDFLQRIFKHEGHGASLPPEHEEAIIQKWPDLKN